MDRLLKFLVAVVAVKLLLKLREHFTAGQEETAKETPEQKEEVPQHFQHLGMPIYGIDQVLQDLIIRLDKCTCVGLVGMGGVGKTTIAMDYFSSHRQKYEYTCFLREVKKVQGGVQNAVLENIYHRGHRIALRDLRVLREQELLLVLDDVAKKEDFEIVSLLLGDRVKVHENSRIIATSRDSQLLQSNDFEVYRVPRLNHSASEQVFLSYVFEGVPVPPPRFEVYVRPIVEKCRGLPLHLELTGRYLRVHGKSTDDWEEALVALTEAGDGPEFDKNLLATLRISFDKLPDLAKDMFLDAAEVLNGVSVDEAKTAWSTGRPNKKRLANMHWTQLLDLSLVSQIGHKVGMHEQLSILAKKLPPVRGRRIWDDKEEVAELLTVLAAPHNSQDHDLKLGLLQDIRALKLHSDREMIIRGGHNICKMEKLRYLEMNNVRFNPPLDAELPPSLVRFSGRAVNFTHLPVTPSVHKHLVLLRLEDCGDIFHLPANVSLLSSLQTLDILGSSSLERLPDKLGFLESLETLRLAGPFRALPNTLGRLKKLRNLSIGPAATRLNELPPTLGGLSALETLTLNGCFELSSLPASMGHLSRLKTFACRDCMGIRELPDTFVNLRSLESLTLLDAPWNSIPDLALLKNLKYVLLKWLAGARCSSLPPCLAEVITESEISSGARIEIDVVDGQFRRRS